MTVLTSTLAQLRAEVTDKLRLDADGDDATRVDRWLNQVYVTVATKTSCLVTNATATMTGGEDSYVVPSSIVHIDEITLSDSSGTAYPPMVQSSLDEILRRRAFNQASSGVPYRYAVVGMNQIEFFPKARTGDVLTFWYSYLPDKLTADGDISLLPEPFGSKLLVYGACVEAADFKNDTRLYFYYQQAYAQWEQDLQAYVNRRPGDYPGAFAVWGPDKPGYVPSDRSSDFWVTGPRG